MTLYDFLAPAYDPAFLAIYRPFREQALAHLPHLPGGTVLDLACGTGQNLPLLLPRIGGQGRVAGVDISAGMLRRAGKRAARLGRPDAIWLQADGARLSREILRAQGLDRIDAVVCTYGFTSMREWRAAFSATWDLLEPGGTYLIHDVDGRTRNLHTRLVELATHSHFASAVWEPLAAAGTDFRMDYIEPSAHLFGGRLFVARGVKPFQPRACPF